MKKLYAVVLALILALSMMATAHAAPAVEGTWVVNSATYTEAGAQYMNEYFPVEGFPWMAGVPYPAVTGACYIFTDTLFSSTVPASSSEYTWVDGTTFQAGDAYWSVSVSGDSMVLTEAVLGTAYACTRVAGTGGESGGGETGGETGGTTGGAPNTADPFSLGLCTTMAVSALAGMVALKKKSRG